MLTRSPVLALLLVASLLVALVPAAPAAATASALTRRDLRDAGFHLAPGTAMPSGAALRAPGDSTTLGKALDGKPALLVFTDYRCQSLCGVVLDQLAAALPTVALTMGRDYGVIAVSLDPAQTPDDAIAFRDAHTRGSRLHEAGLFFADDAPGLAAMRASVGLVAPFDAEHQQFAHPAGLVLVDAQGRAQRILSPFALNPFDLKLALTDGGAAPQSLVTHALLLCYGWDPVAGLYTLRIERVLMMAAAATILLIVLTVGGFIYRERRLAREA